VCRVFVDSMRELSGSREWDVGGQNALHLAAKNSGYCVCDVLKCRADVNTLDDNHQSPLFLAGWEGQSLECEKVLLDYDATNSDAGAYEWKK
jgi:ankyrin repeat protein